MPGGQWPRACGDVGYIVGHVGLMWSSGSLMFFHFLVGRILPSAIIDLSMALPCQLSLVPLGQMGILVIYLMCHQCFIGPLYFLQGSCPSCGCLLRWCVCGLPQASRLMFWLTFMCLGCVRFRSK
jgi:hypothetical protein